MGSQCVVITIGRGQVGSARLLGPETWEQFKRDIGDSLKLADYDVWVDSDGTGQWTDQLSGVQYSEQNHVWVAGLPDNDRLSESTWHGLWRRYLARLAARYSQDAIAFAWGPSELITARDDLGGALLESGEGA